MASWSRPHQITTNEIIAPNLARILTTRSLQCALITNNPCKWLTSYCHYWICQRWSTKLSSFKVSGFVIAKHLLFTVIISMELSLITGSNYLALPWLLTWQAPYFFFCNNDNFLCLPNLFIPYIVDCVCSMKMNLCFRVIWSKCVGWSFEQKSENSGVSLWQRQEGKSRLAILFCRQRRSLCAV